MQNDVRLVEAARAGDPDAFAALFDHFADAVHAFCHGRLADDVAAGDALRTTFVRAGRRLDLLDDPATFRPWIFAIARSTVAELADERGPVEPRASWGPVGGRRSPSRTPDESGSGPRPRPTPEEIASLVADAATALSRRDRELFGLHLREGLDGTDLAVAMSVEPHDVDAMVEQLKNRLSASVGPLLVARMGHGTCDELDDLLADWNGTYSRGIRSRVSRHIDGCRRCRRTRDTAIAWESIGAMMSTPPPPTDVRAAVLDALTRDSSVAGDREAVTPAPVTAPAPGEASTIILAEPPAPPDGPTPAPDVTAGRRRRFGSNRATTVVVALLVAGAAMIGLSAVGGERDEIAGAEGVAVTETSSPTPTLQTPTPTPSPPTPTPSPAPTTTTSPTTTVDPLIGPLFFGSTSPVDLPTEGSTVTYTFANVGDAPMPWTASTSAPFTVDATAGTAAAGEPVTLTIGLDSTAAPDDQDGTLVIGTDRGRFTIALRSAPPPPA